jgi:signal transduction histidine kinase
MQPILPYASEDERERLVFRLLLLNKWFLIPTSVAYEWVLTQSPYQSDIRNFITAIVVYTSISLFFILQLWWAYRHVDHVKKQSLSVITILNNVSYFVDVVFILYLVFSPKVGNILWLIFLLPITLVLLTPQVQKLKSMVVDIPFAIVMLLVIYLMIVAGFVNFSDNPLAPTRIPLLQGDALLCLSGMFFMWVSVRMTRNWLDSMNTMLFALQKQYTLWSETLHRFPAEYLLVDEQGVLVLASDLSRKLFDLPENFSRDWPESSQPIRNALLLRFHSEMKIDEAITVPDDHFSNPIKIFPVYFSFDNRRYCIALAQEENPEAPQPTGILRSDRLTIAGQIAAGLAHEIGNPLGVIHSCASYLKQKHAEHPNREEFELIEKESKRCQNMIDRLLSLASPKRDTLAVHDLRDILDHANSLVKYQAGARDCELTVPDEPVYVHANDGQLSAVFVNLFLNALQSMEKSHQEAKLRTQMRVRGIEAIIDVTDEGEGIRKEELEKIFDPFFTKKASGTGLGLYMVHQVITGLNGRIDVASTVGSGTTFTIHLPLHLNSQES